MTDRKRNGLILLLVAGLIAASAVAIATRQTFLGLDLKGGIELVYKAQRTPRTPVNANSLNQAVEIMRKRVDSLGVAEPQIETTGGTQITVSLPNVTDTTRAEAQVGTTANLFFYDWEANALTPNGKTVASQLLAQDPTALLFSRGPGQGSRIATGDPQAGGTSLYEAVKLAAAYKNPPIGKFNSRLGPQYYEFGAPGSAACQASGKRYGFVPVAGQYCYLSGPDTTVQALYSGLPAGVSKAQGQVLSVPQGLVVLQAVPSTFNVNAQPNPARPSTRFFTLLDHTSLTGGDITSPQASTDQSSGTPDVNFGLTSTGARAFQSVTSAIAKRGALYPSIPIPLNQHFAVALDTQLITVPQISFRDYPDGIIGNGSDITGGFTATSASSLATQLRLGALPIKLNRISEQTVSASLGKQALNQGLVAGAIGLLIVVGFLLVYYRLLGLIATAGLVAYGIYFYALIKLIPITMTLAGIAGLILTIGVAADANIVIFERVKEEIRAGRSIRQGIAIGYKKGLSAIIDANTVTILTAFILFVLATADVKGFAFTLGIGTIVSLFTAVLATQAILSTAGDSRAIARPSALGAGAKKHVWRFDFMGSSKYFFSMSGVILLVGALAVGGRGLNLGIDFTAGTQITVGLERPATQQQVTSLMTSIGVKNPRVQRVIGDSALGRYGFQIASNKTPNRNTVQNALQTRWGVQRGGADFNFTSVGPTFGKSVANSAVIAIIISLLVISGYVAIRFEWKFAIPVLIALMHDLLITSGVYALTGRPVATDTVAALLTILGYSLYDTIIVFDRVRENVPRMPRAAFSQIVNRSMSEVLTRSLATTSCTLLPVIALLLFGGSTLKDFAFALLIGVASGAYSSIFIASPVLTHWKEREHGYRARRRRIEGDHGTVPAYAGGGADIEPAREKAARRAGRLTTPEAETVSAAEFEQMKRDLEIEQQPSGTQTSRLTKRLAHHDEDADSSDGEGGGYHPAPDIAENEGMAHVEKPKPKPKSSSGSRSRNRRHGRPR